MPKPGGGNVDRSPGRMSPRVGQLVQRLHPCGKRSQSQKGVGAVPGGHGGQRSVKRRLPLTHRLVAQVVSW